MDDVVAEHDKLIGMLQSTRRMIVLFLAVGVGFMVLSIWSIGFIVGGVAILVSQSYFLYRNKKQFKEAHNLGNQIRDIRSSYGNRDRFT